MKGLKSPKTYRAMHIKQTHIPPLQPNLLKEHVSPTHGLKDRIKHENTTRYIKHLAESAYFKGGAFNKLDNGLIGNLFEMPNVSYTYPLAIMLRKPNCQSNS